MSQHEPDRSTRTEVVGRRDALATCSIRRLLAQPVVLVVIATTLLASMQVSVIAPVLPAMSKALGISSGRISLLITVFVLPGVVVGPFVGFLADLLGRRRVLIPALFVWSAAGTACFFTQDFASLIVLRFLQGIGSAPLYSMGAIILGDVYTGRDRATVMGLNASVMSAGAGVFPAVGGAVALIAWNAPFLIFVIGFLVLAGAIFFLDLPPLEYKSSLKGYFTQTGRYLRSVQVISLYLAALLTFTVIFGAVVFFLPVLMTQKFSTSPFTNGLMISVLSLTTAAVATQLGRLTKHWSDGQLALTGLVIYAIAVALLPLAPSLWAIALVVALLGVGHGLNMPSLQTRAAGMAPQSSRGMMVSLLSVHLRLGMTLGPLAMSFFEALTTTEHAFWLMGGLALVGAALAGPGLLRERPAY